MSHFIANQDKAVGNPFVIYCIKGIVTYQDVYMEMRGLNANEEHKYKCELT